MTETSETTPPTVRGAPVPTTASGPSAGGARLRAAAAWHRNAALAERRATDNFAGRVSASAIATGREIERHHTLAAFALEEAAARDQVERANAAVDAADPDQPGVYDAAWAVLVAARHAKVAAVAARRRAALGARGVPVTEDGR